MKRCIAAVLIALIAGCSSPSPEAEPDFSRPLGHYDDGHLHAIVLGAIDRGDAVEYVLHFSSADGPARLLDAALLRADGEPVTPLEPLSGAAAGEVRILFPATDGVTHVGVRYESPNGVRRSLLVPVRAHP